MRAKALALLSRREYTEQGLFRRLYPAVCTDAACVRSVVAECVAQGWLCEHRFMEAFLHAKRSQYGVARMVLLARQQGLSEALCAALRERLLVDEAEVLRLVWQKKFRHLPRTPQEKRQQWQYLKYRGFADAMIFAFLQGQA